MDTKLSKEQIAHDIAIALCSKSFPNEDFPNGDSDVDDFVQEYEKLYTRVLRAVKAQT